MSARSIAGSRARQLSQAATRSLPTPGGQPGRGERLVEVGVRLAGGGEDAPAVRVELGALPRRVGDRAAVEQHVAERAVGQPDAAQRRDGRPGEMGRAVGGPYLL